MKKIVKMLRTVELSNRDPLIGDVSYTLNINEADPLIKNGWAVLVAEIEDPPSGTVAKDQAKPKAAAKKRAAPKRSSESMTTKKARYK